LRIFCTLVNLRLILITQGCAWLGKRQNYKESPEEELDHLLEELALTHEQREFIESMRQDGVDKNNEE
jgi:hypothetical protein